MPQGRRSIGDAARGGPLRDKKARCPSPSPTRRGCARASRMGKMYASALKKARPSFAQRFDNASPTMSCTQRRRCGDRVLRQPACLSNQSVLSLSLAAPTILCDARHACYNSLARKRARASLAPSGNGIMPRHCWLRRATCCQLHFCGARATGAAQSPACPRVRKHLWAAGALWLGSQIKTQQHTRFIRWGSSQELPWQASVHMRSPYSIATSLPKLN